MTRVGADQVLIALALDGNGRSGDTRSLTPSLDDKRGA